MHTREYMKHGRLFSDHEINELKRKTAREVVAPLRQNLPYIAIGIAALTAWETQDYGLLAMVVAVGAAGAISYHLGPKAIDKIEDIVAENAQFEQRVVYR